MAYQAINIILSPDGGERERVNINSKRFGIGKSSNPPQPQEKQQAFPSPSCHGPDATPTSSHFAPELEQEVVLVTESQDHTSYKELEFQHPYQKLERTETASQIALNRDFVEENDSDCEEDDFLLRANNQLKSESSLPRGRRIMEARSEFMKRWRFKALSTINTATGGGCVLLIFIWGMHYRGGYAWHSNYDLQFNWHPFLMTLSMIFLFSQSMLIYRWKRDWSKPTLKIIHAGLHVTAFICAVIGLKAVFDYHNYSDPPKPNLYTMHSWIGLFSIILFAAQYFIGFVTFLYPGLSTEIRKYSLPIHTYFGCAIFLFCVCAVLTGLTEKTIWTLPDYKLLPPEGVLVNIIALFLAVTAAQTLYLVNDPQYKREPLNVEQIPITEHTE